MPDDWNVINFPRVYKHESFLAVNSTLFILYGNV